MMPVLVAVAAALGVLGALWPGRKVEERGWPVPRLSEGRLASALARRRLQARLRAEMPDTLDLLCLAIGAGETIGGALRAVGARGRDPTAGLIRAVVADVDSGQPLAAGLRRLPEVLGEDYRPVARVLATALAEGASVGDLILRLGEEASDARRRDLEIRARRIPVLLLFPLVGFSLPALVIGALVPLILVSVG